MSVVKQTQKCIDRLPNVRGRYVEGQSLSDITWFRAGGAAEVLFTPVDANDLKEFLINRPNDLPLTILGAGSNTLVRDGGVAGVTIRLGKGFSEIDIDEDGVVTAGAAARDITVARQCRDACRSGLEFLSGIPGTIGGALAMNAGAYGGETRDRLIDARAFTLNGEEVSLTAEEMGMRYRTNPKAGQLIFISARFTTIGAEKTIIEERMIDISDSRETSQPIRSRTGGSTFKNPGGASPEGPKAWKLIDAAGCRGLEIGSAQVSEQHCNFLINHGGARAADIELLGETVRQRVLDTSGIELHWEIKRIGVPL